MQTNLQPDMKPENVDLCGEEGNELPDLKKKMSNIGLLSLTDMTQPLISGDP